MSDELQRMNAALDNVGAEGFTCPDCGKTSHHPGDVLHRYCGHCHAFKGETDWPRLARALRDSDAEYLQGIIDRALR